jgi:hypothetical protein
MPSIRDELRDELLAVTAARQELPRNEERYLIEHFLDNLDREIDSRIEARTAGKRPRSHTGLISVALGAAIPLSAIAVFAGWHGLLVTWVAILLVVYLATRD